MKFEEVGMDALKRHIVVALVPIFFIVKVTAGRLPDGTVEEATKESVEVDVK